MKNTKIVLTTFFLLFLTGIVITGIATNVGAKTRRGLIIFEYDRSLRPESLNRNFQIISEELDRLTDMVRAQELEIRRLRSNESRLRYYIEYLYKSSTRGGKVKSAEDWWRNILPEVENARRDLGFLDKR